MPNIFNNIINPKHRALSFDLVVSTSTTQTHTTYIYLYTYDGIQVDKSL